MDLFADFACSIRGEFGVNSTKHRAVKPVRDSIRFRVGCSWSMSEVTRILSDIDSGDRQAADELLTLVYSELRKLAAAKLANERPGQTLQATALVHEAFMRLVGQATPQQWDNSRHFFSAAAESMRRILIERARERASLKRGGDRDRIELHAVEPAVLPLACDDILFRVR